MTIVTNNPTKANLELATISKEQLATSNIPPEQLWYLLSDEGPVGPYLEADLKTFLLQAPHFSAAWQLAPYLNPKWQSLATLPAFGEIVKSRRIEPSSFLRAPRENVKPQSFFLLQSGQKSGPFTLDEIEEMLERKELLYNQLISTDNCESWIRVYEHEHFERRKKNSLNKLSLPSFPKQETFEDSTSEAWQYLQTKNTSPNKNDGLVDLALVGKGGDSHSDHLNDNGETKYISLDEETATMIVQAPAIAKKGNYWLIIGTALLAGIGVTFTLLNMNNGSKDVTAKNKNAEFDSSEGGYNGDEGPNRVPTSRSKRWENSDYERRPGQYGNEDGISAGGRQHDVDRYDDGGDDDDVPPPPREEEADIPQGPPSPERQYEPDPQEEVESSPMTGPQEERVHEMPTEPASGGDVVPPSGGVDDSINTNDDDDGTIDDDTDDATDDSIFPEDNS